MVLKQENKRTLKSRNIIFVYLFGVALIAWGIISSSSTLTGAGFRWHAVDGKLHSVSSNDKSNYNLSYVINGKNYTIPDKRESGKDNLNNANASALYNPANPRQAVPNRYQSTGSPVQNLCVYFALGIAAITYAFILHIVVWRRNKQSISILI